MIPAVLLTMSSLAIQAFMEPSERTHVIAHRGFSGAAPENTLAAFEKAIDAGAETFELGVLLSRDGHVVVIHDDTVADPEEMARLIALGVDGIFTNRPDRLLRLTRSR